MKDIVIAICLVLEAAGSAIAADHDKKPIHIDGRSASAQEKKGLESELQVYFAAHRSVEDDF